MTDALRLERLLMTAPSQPPEGVPRSKPFDAGNGLVGVTYAVAACVYEDATEDMEWRWVEKDGRGMWALGTSPEDEAPQVMHISDTYSRTLAASMRDTKETKK